MSKIEYVNLGDLKLPEFQAHRNINKDILRELSDSIISIGIIEPLIIRKTSDGLEIVAGCLRYEAARLAGLKAVPCIVMSLLDHDAEVIKLHENIKRVSLDHVDQGHTFIMMMHKFDMTENSIAKSVGKSIGYVSQHISLVRLNNELTSAVEDGSISFSQARELMRVDNKTERMRLLGYCQHDGATVQVLQRWVQDYKRSVSSPPDTDSDTPEITYDHSTPILFRTCEACLSPVNINEMRHVLFCPTCESTILSAISDERKVIKQDP